MRHIRAALVAATFVLLTGSQAQAGWISFLGGLASGGAALTAPAAPVAGGLCVGEVALIGLDAWLTFRTPKPPASSSPPPSAGSNTAPAASTQSQLLQPTYQPLSLTGGPGDVTIVAANGVIAHLNSLLSASAAGDTDAQLLPLRQEFAQSLNSLGNAFQSFENPSFTQAELNSGLANIQANGLPSAEVAFLSSSGWSTSDIQTLQTYTGNLNDQISGSSVSASQIFYEAASLLIVPEPSTLTLGSTVIMIMSGSWLWRRKRLAASRSGG